MNLQRHSRKKYDIKSLQRQLRKQYDVFDVIGDTGSKGVVLLQINPGNVDTFDAEEAMVDAKMKMLNEEYMFLTENLGWKEGLNGEECNNDPKGVTKLAKEVFLTKQLGRRKGLQIFGEKVEQAIEK